MSAVFNDGLPEVTDSTPGMAVDPSVGDANLMVKFHTEGVYMEHASKEAGRAIFKDMEFITVESPGDRRTNICRQVTDRDIRRFERQYKAFKDGVEQKNTGTPLDVAGFLSPSQISEYNYFKIFTVEQMADMSENVTAQFMGAQNHKRAAQKFLEGKASAEQQEKLAAELKSRDDRIADLEAKLETLLNQSEEVVEEYEED